MNNDAQFRKEPAVSFLRTLPGPIERVWEFLSEPALLPSWYGQATIEPKVGGMVNIMGGHVRGVVTQWQPPYRLTYTWNVFSPGQEVSDYPESYLTLQLEPAVDKVILRLNHLPVLERFEKQNAMGWHTFLDMLTAAILDQTLEPRSAYMKRNAAIYGVDLGNLIG